MAHIRVRHPSRFAARALASPASKAAVLPLFRTGGFVHTALSTNGTKRGTRPRVPLFVLLAEREGFEPSMGY
jgi:hypothetical protein